MLPPGAEGLSVGEWLTGGFCAAFPAWKRRPPPWLMRAAPPRAPLGLPPSSASRAHTKRRRPGSGAAKTNFEKWKPGRRIDDQLRGGPALGLSERSHGESNRVISRTAQEMSITAREQSPGFRPAWPERDGAERTERLERSAAHDGIKDAVKALHQGLSRLADQITATANNSASQCSSRPTWNRWPAASARARVDFN